VDRVHEVVDRAPYMGPRWIAGGTDRSRCGAKCCGAQKLAGSGRRWRGRHNRDGEGLTVARIATKMWRDGDKERRWKLGDARARGRARGWSGVVWLAPRVELTLL
jgi:hypothetical protein